MGSSSSSPATPVITCHTPCSVTESQKVNFRWTLHNFESLFQRMGWYPGRRLREVTSDTFSIPGDTTGYTFFQVKCTRNDDDGDVSDSGNFLGVFVKVLGDKTKRVGYKLSIRGRDGALLGEKDISSRAFIHDDDSGCSWRKPFTLGNLLTDRERLLPGGNLTLNLELVLLNQPGYTDEIALSLEFRNIKSLSEELYECLKDHPETADVVFVCRDKEKEIRCHKTVLSARSPVFRTMFAQKGFNEDTSGRVLVEDFEPEVVEAFVRAAYSDRHVEDIIRARDGGDGRSVVCGVFRAAEKYEMRSLKVACMKILAETVDLDNCAAVMHWALVCNGEPLARMTRAFMRDYITKIVSTKAFGDLMVDFPNAMIE